MTEGELLWTPDPAAAQSTAVARFMRGLRERGHAIGTYDELWRWSVTDLEDFWAAVWDFFEVRSSQRYERVLDGRVMPGDLPPKRIAAVTSDVLVLGFADAEGAGYW